MDIQTLRTIGIGEKASKVYLAALALGTASVVDLAKKSGLKRPTVYGYLKELQGEGLLEIVPLGKREYYRATDPKLLEARAEHALEMVRHSLPELQALRSATEGRPNISVLEGERGLRQVYAEIAEANSICFWSNLEAVERRFGQAFTALSAAVQEKQIRTREIISDTPAAKRSAKRYAATAGKNYSARLATAEGIENDNAIYGNTMAFFRLHESNLFVVRIQDPMLVAAMKAMFDMAWKSAEAFIN